MSKVTTIIRGLPMSGYLLIALALSIGINVWQARAKVIADTKAPLVKKIEVLEVTAAVRDKISKLRAEHDIELAKLRDAASNRAVEREVVYETKIRTLPAPKCAPGQARVDAWNLATGAKL